MTSLPFDDWPDATIALLKDPYRHIMSRCRALGTHGFRTRFLGQHAVCLTGPDAARIVYDQDIVIREGAVPSIAGDVLFGKGGVQGLDKAHHHHRKAMFLRLMGPDADLDPVVGLFDRHCRTAAADWKGEVDVFAEVKRILTRVAFEWAGLRLDPKDEATTADDLANLFLHAGPSPVGQVRARHSRHQLERKLARTVDDIQGGDGAAEADTALSIIAGWKDPDGVLLPAEVAAVELLNVLRPTVAISVYLVFITHALTRHKEVLSSIRDKDDWPHLFTQEVRRTYPFFPATAAIARADISWQDETIEAGCRVLLDIYGTNRDALHWDNPDRFSPSRFADWQGNPYTMIPQGGGDHQVTHRCPGEWLTIRLMESFTRFLTGDLHWTATDPSAEPDYSSLPALPEKPLTILVREQPGSFG